MAGLREEIVSSAEQVLELLKLGEGLTHQSSLAIIITYSWFFFVKSGVHELSFAANRHFGETNMNARSSRSHTIFRMV